MRVQHKIEVKDFLNLGPVAYYITSAFLLAGLAMGISIDLKLGNPIIITLDIVTMVIFIAAHILVITHVVQRNIGLFMTLVAGLMVFWVSGILLIGEPSYLAHFEGNILLNMLLSGLFASLVGLAVSRLAAIMVLLVAVIFYCSMTIVYNNQFLFEQMPIALLILVGNVIVVLFYRSALDKLIQKLRTSFGTLEMQSHTFKALKDKAELLNEINHPFVVFGRNTSGLIHDLKNDVNILSIRTQVMDMKLKRSRPFNEEDIDEMSKAVKRLNDRIDMVKFLANASNEMPMEILSVQSLLEASVYPFKISQNYRTVIDFRASYLGTEQIFSSRFFLLRILENLIQNSCEAIIDQAQLSGQVQGFAGKVIVTASKQDGQVILEVSDNGPGISFCHGCATDNCAKCDKFAIGHTTKAYGSGYGMVNVINAVEQIGATIKISSELGKGTTVSIGISIRDGQQDRLSKAMHTQIS